MEILRYGLWILAVGMLSCSVLPEEDPDLVFNLGKDLVMEAWEDISPQGKQLMFSFETVDRQECLNSLINFNYKYNLSTVHINLNNITTSGDCIIGESYARTDIPIANIPDNVSYYKVNINLKDAVEIQGDIVENHLKYDISIPNKTGITLIHSELRKILPFMVWGGLSIGDPKDEFIVNQFLVDLAYISQENQIEKRQLLLF